MRNLRNVDCRITAISPHSQPIACAWDASSNSLICAFGPHKGDSLLSIKRWQTQPTDGCPEELSPIASWECLCPSPDLEPDRVLDLHFFSDSKTACVVLAGGDVVLARDAPLHDQEKVEIAGSVDAGLVAAAWSPDEELLALVSISSTCILMSRDFESIANISLAEEDLQASKHVSVGWGKTETQFKGRGAQALRDPTIPETVDQGLRSFKDDGSTTISWRGDGAFVAINSPQASYRRVIRVFSRDGDLDSASEPVDHLEAPLSWRPAGNIFASVQRRESQVRVIFFERNGLRHGEFDLESSSESADAPLTLAWNCDSSILAVCFADRLQLWTMVNYHYYLKQEIFTKHGAFSTQRATWHPEDPLLLLVPTEGVCDHSLLFSELTKLATVGFYRLEYAWRTCRESTEGPCEHGTVAVTDGSMGHQPRKQFH